MSLTVDDVLSLPCVAKGRPEVLSGAARLTSPVRWLHVLEQLEASHLLSGGELILSTGLQLDRDPLATADHLRHLQDAGAVGVVVELLATRPGARSALRRAAEQVDIPVVLLTERIRFVEVTEQVHRRIVASQLDLLERHRQVHETFTQASLEGASIESVVETSARLLGRVVLLEDLAGRVLTYAPARERAATSALATWEEISGSVEHRVEAGTTPDGGWLQAPVGVRTDVWGRLVTTMADTAEPESLMVLERAAQALAINRATERDRTSLALQARATCLGELKQGEVTDEDEARVRAAAVGLHAAPAYVAVALRVDTADSPPPAELQRRSRTVRDAVDHALSGLGVEALVAPARAEVVEAVVALPGLDAVGTVVGGLADRIPASPWLRARSHDDQRAWWLGVARPRQTLLGAVEGLDSAAHVAESAAASPSVGSRRYYEAADVRLRGLLATYGEAAGAQSFVAAELGALTRPDRADDLRLLEQFLQCGGNKAELARRAYVSRPTLYARLARIEAELGVPLDDAESRTSLHVALMLHHPS